ncbi:sensor histidine kinase [Mucilaginibacter psychrotolerans]|uniref:Oxygen sensor histidine kinase NreB n=1 Tax=Mucilaginibacter psychrotolerans TaxID=1524096 RepID=A0A4Y8S646_9SPHI|nr:sensor histidine kinase [Mucilaginibacter psychrotolerans]TFF33937.1 sensor histidine kinase [Mucilaginibacter psychrotolerans]
MQATQKPDIQDIVVILTLLFLTAPFFLLIYISLFNRRKKKHDDEKLEMKQSFDNEIVKTQHEIKEQTLQTVGADLHDNVGQLLSLTSFTLKSIKGNEPDGINKKVDAAIELVSRSMQEMRQLGKLLQGEQLISLGLNEAITQEVHWLERTEQYQITYQAQNLNSVTANPEKDLILFRIVQEILNNAVKHSRATRIDINLLYKAGTLQLQVNDNGVGFIIDPSDKPTGMGLMNIKNRAKMIDGTTTITSAPENGTQISVFVPYP